MHDQTVTIGNQLFQPKQKWKPSHFTNVCRLGQRPHSLNELNPAPALVLKQLQASIDDAKMTRIRKRLGFHITDLATCHLSLRENSGASCRTSRDGMEVMHSDSTWHHAMPTRQCLRHSKVAGRSRTWRHWVAKVACLHMAIEQPICSFHEGGSSPQVKENFGASLLFLSLADRLLPATSIGRKHSSPSILHSLPGIFGCVMLPSSSVALLCVV